MQARTLTIRLVRLAMAASLLAPTMLFAFAAWNSYRNLAALTDERLARSLDVEQEEAQRTFQLVDLALNSVKDLVADMSADDIRRDEKHLHLLLQKLDAQIPLIQSIWIYDKDGRSLVSSWIEPAPDESFADRDFFRAHLGGNDGTYYGRVYASRFGAQPFFTVSQRLVHDGAFLGVLEISVLPSNFFHFFATLAYAEGQQFSLIRDDGLFLARYPMAPSGAPTRLHENSGFRRTIARTPAGGLFTTLSPIDHIERRFAARRLDGTPLYVTTGFSTAVMRSEWLWGIAAHLIYGVPVTLFLFFSLFAVLLRTQRLYAEINRRAAAEEALRQSQKLDAIGHLTGGVAHDFNNLLTIIIGNLEAAQRQLESWTDGAQIKLSRRLENAMHGAQRAATLTKRLLAFSRQQPLSPALLDVNRVLNGLSDFLRRALGEDVSLEIVGGGGVWPVEADAAELDAAILNLAVNARDAMPEGGKLTIEASNSYLDDSYCRQNADVQPGQYVQIAVTDTGSGMPKDVIERAFEPFFTTKESGQGTGLGLSQVYGFVKQSGGHVKIYSEAGEGTTIKIYLPRFFGRASAAEEKAAAPRRGRSGESVLVVEDDSDVRDYVVETLASLGYKVFEAGEAESALRLLDENPSVHLLLTDVVMPGMNGRKLAEEARLRRPDLKILYMTGYSRNAIMHQGRLDIGVDLLQKPISSEQLASAVRRMLDA
ncbi:MAG TPA: ATP-binding protein [Xanthobacteraceae bacterium]|nr:ATP-binding protein [Xanthobacteraceae bacterium]